MVEQLPKPKHPDKPYRKRIEFSPAYEQIILGSGAECIVLEVGTDKQKVAAITHSEYGSDGSYGPLQAKTIFYNQRIVHTLFPHNFPKFYASFAEHPDPDIKQISGTIRQRIHGTGGSEEGYSPVSKPKEKSKIQKLFFFLKKGKETQGVTHPFYKAEKALDEMGLKLYLDDNAVNFMLSEDGGEYYVDTLSVSSIAEPSDLKKILEYMKVNKYTKHEMKVVSNSVNRLNQLRERA